MSNEALQQQGIQQQQQAQTIQRQGSTKISGPPANPIQIAPTPHQVMQQHLHETQIAMLPNTHPSTHPHQHLVPPTVVNAPFPGAPIYSRPPSPRLPPQAMPLPIHLGTFVYPRTPFPFFDFPIPIRDVLATILIPSPTLPTSRPRITRLWGGAILPTRARVYTDDSDLVLCAVHAGWVTWSELRRERSAGRDLRLEVRMTREARFMGTFGQRIDVVPPDDDGSMLLSAGWGNGHDGSGIQVLDAKFVSVSSM